LFNCSFVHAFSRSRVHAFIGSVVRALRPSIRPFRSFIFSLIHSFILSRLSLDHVLVSSS